MTGDPEQDFLSAFDDHWDDYRKQLKAARREISEDSIHDLRVSARRLQALSGIIRGLDPHPRVKKLRRLIRKQLNELDDLRDTQVMVHEAEQRVAIVPQLAPFSTYLQVRSDDLAGAAQKDLRKSKPSDLKPRIKQIRKVVKKHSDDSDLVERLLEAVDGAYRKTRGRFDKLDANDPNTIHRVRIAFKEFRYMVEVVHPFLPDYPEDYPGKMHDYQDAMGQVHDTTVLLDALKEYKQDLQQHGTRQAPEFHSEPVKIYYRERLSDLIRLYFERKDELNGFWRLAPDQAFPWEKSHDSVHRTTRNRSAKGSNQQRGARQRAAPHRRRAQKVPADRASAGGSGNSDRPDPDQPVPTGG